MGNKAQTTENRDDHDAVQALTEIDQLRRRARVRAHSGAWFPALAFAVLLLASIGLYRQPFTDPGTILAEYPFWAGLPDNQRDPTASFLFWFIGTPVVFALVAAWYRWRSRRVGMRVGWPVVVALGVTVLAVLAVCAAAPTTPYPDPDTVQVAAGIWWQGLLTPLVPITVAVLVLGLVERSRGLIAAGVWMGLIVWWQCTGNHLGSVPGAGLELLGVHRPGPNLILMAVPLLAFAAIRAPRARAPHGATATDGGSA